MRPPFDHFDLIAPFYDRLIRRPEDDPLPRLLAAAPSDLVLDIGGGTGRMAQAVIPEGARVIVCDASPVMARQAKAKGLPAVVASSAHLPFASSGADRVLVVDAFHHFVQANPSRPSCKRYSVPTGGAWGAHPVQAMAAAELVRVVRPGGRLVVEEPDIRRRAARVIALMEKVLLMGSRFLSPEALAGLFCTAGARLLETRDLGFSVGLVFGTAEEDAQVSGVSRTEKDRFQKSHPV